MRAGFICLQVQHSKSVLRHGKGSMASTLTGKINEGVMLFLKGNIFYSLLSLFLPL
jgi:hypothetical protein